MAWVRAQLSPGVFTDCAARRVGRDTVWVDLPDGDTIEVTRQGEVSRPEFFCLTDGDVITILIGGPPDAADAIRMADIVIDNIPFAE